MGKKSKIILTGGHLAPLLAVYEVLSKKASCVVVGRRHTFEADKTESLEYTLFKKENIPFYNLPAARLQRKFTKHTIPSLFRSPSAFIRARSVLSHERPDVILTFGGYIGLPVALAAYVKGIPIVLHEQTLRAGLTNRTIGKIATKICISYPTSARFFPSEKTVVTGNPVRPEVFTIYDSLKLPAGLPVLYVTGGSAGAHALNTIIEYILPNLLRNFVVIHQTGDAQEFKDYERLTKLKENLPEDLRDRYVLKKFILPKEIGWVYKQADVILSRSGANTVAELIALHKKALLIPLPFGQQEEQLENAKYYESTNLGEYILQKNVNLNTIIKKLLSIRESKIPPMPPFKNDAAEKIAQEVFSVLVK
ncbi:MAG TPA: UDP-N-acetylglucosamine--N-acetylmuramyl-(pentapeptide) pyrophosphoryl-undecaprenol N-acetylglucosamine transferase [Candidatus Levybacteria bacterium]|nr:UDP-N-acetylglucosamine--N-acetylmuramyl-(pentapeptide) pyrophosphoryl-undecaprenol N-acetylglucosamine transferase [Candidatus Levybacteria bacterium]